MFFSLVSFLYFILVCGILFVLLLPNFMGRCLRFVTLLTVNVVFFLSILLWVQFAVDSYGFQHIVAYAGFKELNIHLILGIDGISLFFVLITTLIFPFAVLSVWSHKEAKLLLLSLLCIELFLLLSFTVLDLFFFCLFFESLLIPMVFIIFIYGTRPRRVKALTYFFMYTLIGSVFLLLSLFIIYYEVGSTGYIDIIIAELDGFIQRIVWVLLFIVFAIKIPTFPFHIWLPEAHVEAPTVGSVLLAGLLLKLGGYGILRFLFLFESARCYFQPCASSICLISVWVASLSALRQVDLKRIIAYSSVAHMNFALLGFFSGSVYGLIGGTLLMLSHGIVSSALFFLVGVLYDRYHTRLIYYYGGLVQVMPIFTGVLFLFTVSNFSFPGTSNFVGELLVLVGLGCSPQRLILFCVTVSLFFTLVYTVLLFNRIVYGNLNIRSLRSFCDVTRRELAYLLPLVFLNFLMGLCPNGLIVTLYFSLKSLIMAGEFGFIFQEPGDFLDLPNLLLHTYLEAEDCE